MQPPRIWVRSLILCTWSTFSPKDCRVNCTISRPSILSSPNQKTPLYIKIHLICSLISNRAVSFCYAFYHIFVHRVNFFCLLVLSPEDFTPSYNLQAANESPTFPSFLLASMSFRIQVWTTDIILHPFSLQWKLILSFSRFPTVIRVYCCWEIESSILCKIFMQNHLVCFWNLQFQMISKVNKPTQNLLHCRVNIFFRSYCTSIRSVQNILNTLWKSLILMNKRRRSSPG